MEMEASGATQVSLAPPAAASFLSASASLLLALLVASASSRPPDFDGDCVRACVLACLARRPSRQQQRQMKGDLRPPISASHVNRDVIRSSVVPVTRQRRKRLKTLLIGPEGAMQPARPKGAYSFVATACNGAEAEEG